MMGSKNNEKQFIKGFMVFCCVISLLITGCAHTGAGTSSTLFPGSKANVTWDVAPEAEVVMAQYSLAPYKGVPSLKYDIEIKNISQKEHRYRVLILLDEGPAASVYFPEKGTLKPGKTGKRNLPVLYDQESKGFLVKVEVFD